MVNNYLRGQISHNFPHNPTDDQLFAIKICADFLLSRDRESLLLLKGYAGTGKTSLIGALVKTMSELKQKTFLLAPTGRAAKVFSGYAEQHAYTIHKKIYRQKSFAHEQTDFRPADNLHKDTLFIVDEASMISNERTEGAAFGSGRLLDDLIQYVYAGENCRLILMGDVAQLPPVMQTESPALNRELLAGYGLNVEEVVLTQIVRQSEGSGILYNATLLREALRANESDQFPLRETLRANESDQFPFREALRANESDQFPLREALRANGVDRFPLLHLKGFSDIRKIGGDELIEELESAYSRDGVDETMVITRTNKRTVIYNNGIRNRILYREEELSAGDRLMVVKNNYFWASDCKEMDFIANGEIVQVLRVRREMELYGFRFADVLVRFIDYEQELEIKILLDTLQTDTAGLPRELSDKLYLSILQDYEDLTIKADKIKRLKTDPFYNVVQIKYAYAVTCHKAQGGQWMNVFLDVGYITEEMLGEEFYRWLYTAITRATHRLYLVNLPKEFEIA